VIKILQSLFFNDTDCTEVNLAVQRTVEIGECFLGTQGRYVKFGYYNTNKKFEIISKWWFWFSIVGGLLLITGIIILIAFIFYKIRPHNPGYKKLLADYSNSMFDDNI